MYTSDPEVMKKSKRGKKRKSDRLQRRLGFIFVPCYHLYIYHYSVFDVFSKRCSDIFNSAFFFFFLFRIYPFHVCLSSQKIPIPAKQAAG